jgi:hypothetical protein
MQFTDFAKPMMDFNKAMFEQAWNGINLFNDQVEKGTANMLDQFTTLSNENKKAVSDWTKIYKKACNDFKASVDSSVKNAEELMKTGEKK